ncbi:SDR family NAD(P)-dependent oxidoreductase [Halomonas cupida]|uniref:Oxidoreductase n=1 Tax=Halomonas cupida TaxID=44933 RepID=A0A1M7IVR9_9GAMM|nr:SDR family NAD(P)-dependent oxidoreductase [Halomonas cupida]GEN24207.1 oxidoreductase [Halomonas cupida]SHM44796.1 Short-chain dehydrogenase [Halomonas cupida]
MATPRRLILITGATGAIGGALARRYASDGAALILHGRRQEVLSRLAAECEQLGAESVIRDQTDLNDTAQLHHWIDGLEHCPDMAILCAGMNLGVTHTLELESFQQARQLLDINLHVPMQITRLLAPRMQSRGSGQLVYLSSLAAWYGLPVTPSYSASKAGIKAYGEAMRGVLAPHGVGVSVIMPGYVDSAMARAMPGPKPFQWSPQRAATTIHRAIERNQARCSFPLPLSLGTWCLAVLPAALSQRLVSWFGYGVRRP